MNFRYCVYGLTCLSDTRIPDLWPVPDSPEIPDVRLEISDEPPLWVRKARELPKLLRFDSGEGAGNAALGFKLMAFGEDEFFELQYRHGISFVVDHSGSRLWATHAPGLTIYDLSIYLRGPGMAFVLRRRGITSLHASVVCLEDHGVVLCGASEAGKSTTAAAFALRGVPILSEDIAALKEEQNGFYVQSGYPRISLWPDSVSHLFGNPESLPRILPDWEKRFLNLDDAKGMFEANRRALAAIYLIADRTEESHAPMIENVAAREALLELVQNTFMNYLLDREQRAGEFETLSKLVSRVPVRRVVPHADPSRIGAMCDAIERDTSRLLASAKSKT